jgi:hypothetical protein
VGHRGVSGDVGPGDAVELAREWLWSGGEIWPLLDCLHKEEPVLVQYLTGHLEERGSPLLPLVAAQLQSPWRDLEDRVLSKSRYYRRTMGLARFDALEAWRAALIAVQKKMGEVREDDEWAWRLWACTLVVHYSHPNRTGHDTTKTERILRRMTPGQPHTYPYHGHGFPLYGRGTATVPALLLRSGDIVASHDSPWKASKSPMRAQWFYTHNRLQHGGESLIASAREIGIVLRDNLLARFGTRRVESPWGRLV